MSSKAKRTRGADIVVPATPSATKPAIVPASSIDIASVLDRVQDKLRGCDTLNRNELLIVAIRALIANGVNTAPRLVGAASKLGFSRGHIGAVLSRSEGSDPARHQWRKAADGTLRTHAVQSYAAEIS